MLPHTEPNCLFDHLFGFCVSNRCLGDEEGARNGVVGSVERRTGTVLYFSMVCLFDDDCPPRPFSRLFLFTHYL